MMASYLTKIVFERFLLNSWHFIYRGWLIFAPNLHFKFIFVANTVLPVCINLAAFGGIDIYNLRDETDKDRDKDTRHRRSK